MFPIKCTSCFLLLGESVQAIENIVCVFCIQERECFIGYFRYGELSSQYDTLNTQDRQWNRHKEMMETKQKINRLYWNNENQNEELDDE